MTRSKQNLKVVLEIFFGTKRSWNKQLYNKNNEAKDNKLGLIQQKTIFQ